MSNDLVTPEQLQQLLAHVREARDRGTPDQATFEALSEAGWSTAQLAELHRALSAAADAPGTEGRRSWWRACGLGCLVLIVGLILLLTLVPHNTEISPPTTPPTTDATEALSAEPQAPALAPEPAACAYEVVE